MASRLENSASPYLRAHAADPVDWYPWGAEAFARARELERPVLLSSGFSSCHWCHVMHRESFSDPVTAELLNDHFICIKLDREERPDVDAFYMAALQTLTGSGGWPLTAVLTPGGRAFFAGTYWPDRARHGLPAFRDVLRALTRAWNDSRAEIDSTAADLEAHLKRQLQAGLEQDEIRREQPEKALGLLLTTADEEYGGFGSAPKFPVHDVLHFLLSRKEPAARSTAHNTLRAIACGGIFDQLGGGLSRYATDRAWREPHFEKMLFDSAQFLGLSARAYVQTGEPGFRRAAMMAADFLTGPLLTADGTFLTSLSAESEGKEGAYYLFSPAEVHDALGPAGLTALAEEAFRLIPDGSFPGRSLPSLNRDWWERADDPGLGEARQLLLRFRSTRTPPAADTKILASHNGLAIENLALAGRLLGEPALTEAADRAGGHLLRALEAGTLSHVLGGDGNLFLEDVAFPGLGFLELYNATFAPHWLEGAWAAVKLLREKFTAGTVLFSSLPTEELQTAGRNLSDTGAPSDVLGAARLCLRFARLRNDSALEEITRNTLAATLRHAAENPLIMGSTLRLAEEWFAPVTELAFAGSGHGGDGGLAAAARRRDLPHALFLHEAAGARDYPLLHGRNAPAGQAAAWLCIDRSCRLPAHTPEELDARFSEPA